MSVKWADPRKKAKDAEKKYETMNYLLYQFGVNNLTKEQFWGQMKQHGWDQPDIDAWCVEYYQRSADEDAKQEAKRQERNGAARATASRDARGSRGESGLVGPRGSHDARQEADRQGDAQPSQRCEAEEARSQREAAKIVRPGQVITLDPSWLERAKRVGLARFTWADERGLINRGAHSKSTPEWNINGCVAECAGGKRFRQKWREAVGDTDGVDVGKIIEVRSRPPGKDMGMRLDDKRYLPNVFGWVYPDHSTLLLGWLWGHEGMHLDEDGDGDTDLGKQLWNMNSQCWYNPPPYRPLEELDAILADDVEVERILQRHLRWVREEMPAAKKAAKDRRRAELG